MNRPLNLRRMAAAGMAAAFSLLLSACLISPGKFDAALDLRRDGQFTYSYKGEIFVLGLSELMKVGQSADESFTPLPCYESDSGEDRACTKEELEQQKADWEEERKANAERRKKDQDMAKALLGGIDASDAKAAEELAARLRRQAGWNSVVYKGNGLYEVDFSIAGRLDHDFLFPTIEKMPQVVPFFALNRRADGSVRLDSPAFTDANQGSTPFGSLAQIIAAERAGKEGKISEATDPQLPVLDGRFVLTTDGTILANNTDEGPATVPTGKRLEWTITPREKTGPMALVQLGK